jgi:hypothetical protein
VTAANSTADYANKMLNIADMEEWMRVFAYNRILGNWDAYTFSVGQNMYAYKQPGERWVLMPWDIDFVLGLGNGSSDTLGGGSFCGNNHDPVANKIYDNPAFRRALWRAYQDAINGPMLPENYSPQIAARRAAQIQNGISGLSSTNGVYAYLNARRNYIINQLKIYDAAQFAITNNNGSDFSSASPTVALTGTAPFAAASIEVNGIPYPVTWTTPTRFSITVPSPKRNRLTLTTVDRHGRPIAPARQHHGDLQRRRGRPRTSLTMKSTTTRLL